MKKKLDINELIWLMKTAGSELLIASTGRHRLQMQSGQYRYLTFDEAMNIVTIAKLTPAETVQTKQYGTFYRFRNPNDPCPTYNEVRRAERAMYQEFV